MANDSVDHALMGCVLRLLNRHAESGVSRFHAVKWSNRGIRFDDWKDGKTYEVMVREVAPDAPPLA